MKRKRLLGIAVVALALAGLVSLAAFRMSKAGPTVITREAVTAPVVAAAVPLQPGIKLSANDLKIVRLPPGALPAHVFSSPKQLDGRVLTAAAVPNEVLVDEMVAAPGSGVGLPPLIPEGMRAVSVKVNDVVSVAGFAVPGTHVDVLLTGNPTDNGSDNTHVTTVTLLSNVQVLTAGQHIERDPNGKPETVAVITLLVDPAGAEKLALADGFGHIQLALRNPLDRVAPKTPPVLNAALYGIPVARPAGVRRHERPAAPAPWTVDMINGSQQQSLKFPAIPHGGDN